MNNTKTSSDKSPLPAEIEQPTIPSLVLPGLHCGNEVLIPRANYFVSPSRRTMPTSCRPLPEIPPVDHATERADEQAGRQECLFRYAFARQRENRAPLQGITGLQASITRKPCRSCTGNVHIGLAHGLSSRKTGESPTVVDEQNAYWVVKKALCNLPTGKRERTGNNVDNCYGLACAESLATFLQGQHPEQHFPVLSSRQHNFGVIFHLENSWMGLNIVAKSETAYASFQRLLELQQIQSYLECFVVGPPLLSATQLFGTTATSKTKLCIEVLQSTVCRTAGSAETRNCSINNIPSSGSTSSVVSHVILRINFPPILLPDVLWCNGLAVTSSPYVRNTAEGATEHRGSLCCFALTFPQVNARPPPERLEEKFPGNSRICNEHSETPHFEVFPLARYLPALSIPLQYSGRLTLSQYLEPPWSNIFSAHRKGLTV